MRSAGIVSLVAVRAEGPWAASETLQELGKHFPDEQQHLTHWSCYFRVADVLSLTRMLRYDGPLELLSMCLCLYQVGTVSNKRMGSDVWWDLWCLLFVFLITSRARSIAGPLTGRPPLARRVCGSRRCRRMWWKTTCRRTRRSWRVW